MQGHSDFDDAEETAGENAETLSPAVRRLVKQYDLDITAIRGSGPSGRIKVGDVMATLGSRAGANSAVAAAPETASLAAADDAEIIDGSRDAQSSSALRFSASATTVFECDIGRITAHHRRQRERGVNIALESYFLTACSAALRSVPEANAAEGPIHLLCCSSTDGKATTSIVRNADELPLEALNGALIAARKFDEEQAQEGGLSNEDLRDPAASARSHRGTFTVHDFGSTGCVFAMPAPLDDGQAASLGIGRVRRQIVVRTINGEDAPRAASLCYLTLTYDPKRIGLQRAHLFLATLVRLLEQWPEA